ncbi:MAG: heme-binding protein, partial [Roseimicrobium sp.]
MLKNIPRFLRTAIPVALALAVTIAIGIVSCTSYEANYPRTAAGIVEVKTLPAGRVIETTAAGDYHEQDDSMFLRLFNYIRENKIAMTVPVEGGMKPGTMRFFIEEKLADKRF